LPEILIRVGIGRARGLEKKPMGQDMATSVLEESDDISFLIIDDDPNYAEYLAMLIGTSLSENALIDIVSNVLEALRKLTDFEYDVCFLNYSLEPFTGLDVLRSITFRDTLTAFIFLTSNEQREVAGEAQHFGAMDYLVKSNSTPFEIVKAVSFALYRKRREREFRNNSLRDPLTGLGNRALFDEQLATTLPRAEREKHKFGVAMIDLDDFKPVNDTFGHQVGDEVLCGVANRLLRQLRRSDTTARLGGDEFAALILGGDESEILREVGAKIGSAIADRPFKLNDQELSVGATVGIAIYPDDAKVSVDLIRIADVRMYKD
jgi:two-component system cell cycle response regulator